MTFVRRLLGASCLAALTAAATAACSSPAGPLADQSARLGATQVAAWVVDGTVEIHNASNRRIFYLVVNPMFLGDWATCTDTTSEWCYSVAPGATARVPRHQIFGIADSTRDIVVYWWDANVDASSAEPAKAIREIALRL